MAIGAKKRGAPPRVIGKARPMLDIVFCLATLAFFFATAAYAAGCDRL